MSYYHIEGNGGFKNLPERILVREDGYMTAYRFYGEPIVDYWYVPEAENEKLREWCSELLHMAESNDPDFLHWPEIHDELKKLGVEIARL